VRNTHKLQTLDITQMNLLQKFLLFFYNFQVLFLQVDKQTLSLNKTSIDDTRNSSINSMYNVKLKDETKKLY
jgi:hypothetical protein